MPSKASDVGEATITTKGQITIPRKVRDALGLKTGDKVKFVKAPDGSMSIEARKCVSILEIAREHPVRARAQIKDLDRAINEAIGEAMADRERRGRRRGRP